MNKRFIERPHEPQHGVRCIKKCNQETEGKQSAPRFIEEIIQKITDQLIGIPVGSYFPGKHQQLHRNLFRNGQIGNQRADKYGGCGDGHQKAESNGAGAVVQSDLLNLAVKKDRDFIKRNALKAGQINLPGLFGDKPVKEIVFYYFFNPRHGFALAS
jgi:hypothetical protein